MDRRNQSQDLAELANVFYANLNEDSTWDNPFGYHKWKPDAIMAILGEEPEGQFSELHQDSLSDEQRQYAYMLYKTLPGYLSACNEGSSSYDE
jgi:hypothetical protein